MGQCTLNSDSKQIDVPSIVPIDNFAKSQNNSKYQLITIPTNLIQLNEPQNRKLNRWIIAMYDQLCEASFIGFYKKEMDQTQSKVYFCRNFIYNVVKMMRKVKKEIKAEKVFDILNQFSREVLKYQIKKYPQRKKVMIRPEIEQLFDKSDRMEDPQYDMLKNSKFIYKYTETGNYYKQIKLMINMLINLTNEHYKGFQKFMKSIFVLETDENGNPKTYIHNQIGRKMNENTPLFSEVQLESNGIDIKTTEILRVLIKWIVELEYKINEPQKHIINKYHAFVSKIKRQLKFDKPFRQKITQRFKLFLENSKQNQLNQNNMQVLRETFSKILTFIDHNSLDFQAVSDESKEIDITTVLVSKVLSVMSVKYINQMIHAILSFQKSQSEDQQNPEKFFAIHNVLELDQNFGNVQYISFTVTDLLRARCFGKYEQIKIVCDKIKATSEFKIVRVKNRLMSPNRDFLINFRYNNTALICELQICLVLENSKETEKEDCLNHFNHFLYELSRTKYGAMSEATYINAHYAEGIQYFENRFKQIELQYEEKVDVSPEKRQRYYPKLNVKPRVESGEIVIDGFSPNEGTNIFVCSQCVQIKNPIESFARSFIRKSGDIVCGECILKTLDLKTKYTYLLEEHLHDYLELVDIQKTLNDRESVYCLIISKVDKRPTLMLKTMGYFCECFTHLKYGFQFKTIEQLNIKYSFELKRQIEIHQMKLEDAVDAKFQNVELLTKLKEFNCKEINYIHLKNGKYHVIDGYTQLNRQDYFKAYQLHKKTQFIKKIIESKAELIDLSYWKTGKEFLYSNISKISYFTKIVLDGNELDELPEFNEKIKKALVEIKMNSNQVTRFQLNAQKLEIIELEKNKITDFIPKGYPKLKKLYLSHNLISDIDLNANPLLKEFRICSNKLTRIELSNLEKLKIVDLAENSIQEIRLNNCKTIEQLFMQKNNIEQINISELTNLTILYLQQNKLSSLSVKTNTQLENLYVANNKLKQLDLTNISKLKNLEAQQNQLESIVFYNNSVLNKLYLSNNKLKTIDLSHLTALKKLDINKNMLAIIDLQFNTQLSEIEMSENKLKSIDLNNQTKLVKLNLCQNQLSKIDLSTNNLIEQLSLSDNKLSKIDISNLKMLKALYLIKNNLTDLDLSHNQELNEVDASDNQLADVKLDKLVKLDFLKVTGMATDALYSLKNNNPSLKILG